MTEQNLTGSTPNIAEENIEKLKQIFPDTFAEGKIDFDKLKQDLGEYIDEDSDRYNFTWHGKGQALRLAQTSSTGTLRPCIEESKNWDTTQNLYIEGDNLEVLKLLQKSYHGKVKMIYIDPPYNTGNDFVYPDDYKDNLENYLKITGQVDEEGKKIGTNREANGRYHTDWLNMMYPRLRLARNLLTDDGVIFISIDDNEQDNLKKLCNEVFGEENFAVQLIWTKTSTPPSLSYKCRKTAEYILGYEKIANNSKYFGAFLDNCDAPFLNTGNPMKTIEFPAGSINFTYIENGMIEAKKYDKVKVLTDIIVENGKNANIVKLEGEFKWEQNTVNEEIKNGTYFLVKTEKFSIRFQRVSNDDNYKTPNNFWNIELNKESGVGTNEGAVKELLSLKLDKYFDFAKPVTLLERIIKTKCFFDKDSIILDFFSGSATTAHAAMQLNAEDGGKRKFIMVQLPEPCDEQSEAFKAGYKNICEIGKERIRRAGEKIKAELAEKQNGQASLSDDNTTANTDDLDIGFKVLKLDSSNLKKWNPDYDNLEKSLKDMVGNYVPDRTELDVVYEIMLKYGLQPTFPVDTVCINGENGLSYNIYSIGCGALIICLCDDITEDVANSILKLKEELSPETCRVVFKDNGFKDDSVKTNTIEILKLGGIAEFVTV